MLEGEFKTKLKHEIEERFPGSMVLHLDASEKSGIPDLLVLAPNGRWSALEGKRSETEYHRCMKTPHGRAQQYYVDLMNDMSHAAFIFPENKEIVLNEIQSTLKLGRPTRLSRSK